MNRSVDELLELDARHVWHPYASVPARFPPLAVTGAQGVRIRLADGRELVDGMASWWAAIHGYRHPVLDAALREQLESMAHVMFGGLTHEPAVLLAERLVGMISGRLQHVFFADSGSVAIEVAAKMCLQYWQGVGGPRRHRFLSLRGGYHGDTFMAMSLSDPTTGMHHLFEGAMPMQLFVDRPPPGTEELPDAGYVRHLETTFEAHGDTLAAVVIEPVVQGAGGMHFYAPSYVKTIRDLCDRHGTLLVADEIATGFGRTGEMFAVDHAGVKPDVMCVGKALTGGYLSLAATLCTPAVAEGVGAGGAKALMHGPTYMGNPLACAVALANLSLIDRGDWRRQVAAISACLSDRLAAAHQIPHVTDVRVFGGIGVIELDHAVDMTKATSAAVDRGVWLRPFGRLVYAMPPYTVGAEDVSQIADAMVAAAACS